MSWFDRGRIAFALLATAGLSGCFQPLYGEAAHPGLVAAMKEVEVTPVQGRLGAYLVDDLITDMNGSGETPKSKYKLAITVSQATWTPTVESQIGVASSVTLVESANVTLTKIEGGEVIYKGMATSTAPYDRSLDSFADLRASRDAELRLARSLAQEIELRVAAALGAKMNPGS